MSDAGLMYLVPVSGPPIESMSLKPKEGGLTIGRSDQCDLLLPADADRVSRFHARFNYHDGEWHLADLNSRWGTSVNGVRVLPGPEVMISEGDLIRLSPFTFTFTRSPVRRGIASSDDTGRTIVRTVDHQTNTTYDQMLGLLLESAQKIHEARDEKALAEQLMDAALRGSGLTNAAMLKPIDAAGSVEILASRFGTGNVQGASFSRSLLAAASRGESAEISGGNVENFGQSIVSMGISSAICIPLMLGSPDDVAGQTVAAYLYLDSRGTSVSKLRPFATAFCAALGRIASLSLANLKRIEIERRQASMEAELASALAAQKWILPPRSTKVGPVNLLGESRPGQYVGGDFYDVIELDDGRIAIAIGDVSGKGISASVLMTATQGYLHAALRHYKDPAEAITMANRFVGPRRPPNKFVTVWIGILDPVKRTLRYVDAGHSYALLIAPDGTTRKLAEGGGPPIGMLDDADYEPVEVPLDDAVGLLLLSDGIVEQFGLITNPDGTSTRDQFGVEGAIRTLQRVLRDPDPIMSVYNDVIQHAGSPNLSDDATVVWAKWE
ncbi:MAG: SpoIIE family protein phosphatase [Tepidisphaeraceae bacterium]